jgi:transposase
MPQETKENNNTNKKLDESQTITGVIDFLRMFMTETLAKRLICIILLSVGLPNKQVAQLSGFCEKTVKSIKKRLDERDISALFKVGGGGRKSKCAGLEEAIIDEINRNQYHSRQQIADMIFEKYGVKLSVWAVGRLLKKTELND